MQREYDHGQHALDKHDHNARDPSIRFEISFSNPKFFRYEVEE